jgi:5'(3')-deoxyribonucleotidase
MSMPPINKIRVFVDMDGVIVDFDTFKTELGLTGDEVKKRAGAYQLMKPLPGALDGIKSLVGMGFDVWLATKPPTGVPHAYADKVSWVLENLPEMKRKIILTHDKSLLRGEYLIDDRPHKANAQYFQGKLITFGIQGWDWLRVLEFFRSELSRFQYASMH